MDLTKFWKFVLFKAAASTMQKINSVGCFNLCHFFETGLCSYTFISRYLKKIMKIGFPELENKFLQRFRSFFVKLLLKYLKFSCAKRFKDWTSLWYKGLVIMYGGRGWEGRQNLFKWRQLFIDPPLKKGWKSQWPTPLHLAESGTNPPLVIVVRSIRAIGMCIQWYDCWSLQTIENEGRCLGECHLIDCITVFNQNLRNPLYSDLPTLLDPKPGGYGPKHFLSHAGTGKFFWTPFEN